VSDGCSAMDRAVMTIGTQTLTLPSGPDPLTVTIHDFGTRRDPVVPSRRRTCCCRRPGGKCSALPHCRANRPITGKDFPSLRWPLAFKRLGGDLSNGPCHRRRQSCGGDQLGRKETAPTSAQNNRSSTTAPATSNFVGKHTYPIPGQFRRGNGYGRGLKTSVQHPRLTAAAFTATAADAPSSPARCDSCPHVEEETDAPWPAVLGS